MRLSYFSTTIPPGNLYTFGSGSKRRACERQRKTEGGEIEREREKRRRRSRKNHDAIIFVPARERILRPSGLDRWTEEKKKERRKSEGQKEGLTSSSGRVRDKDVKVVEGDEIYRSEIWGETLTSSSIMGRRDTNGIFIISLWSPGVMGRLYGPLDA